MRFLSTAEGGRSRPAISGHYNPQLRLGSVSSSVNIVRMDGEQAAAEDDLALGETYEVFVLTVFAEYYPDEARNIIDVELCEGQRVVAVGKVTGTVFETAPPSVLSRIRPAT